MCGSSDKASDGSAAAGSVTGSSGGRTPTWSNPGGQDLVQVADDVWAAERPFVWKSIDVGESSDCIMEGFRLNSGPRNRESPRLFDSSLLQTYRICRPAAAVFPS